MSFQKEVGQNKTKNKEIKYLGTEAGLGEEVVNEEKLADNTKPPKISDSGERWDLIQPHNQGNEKKKKKETDNSKCNYQQRKSTETPVHHH